MSARKSLQEPSENSCRRLSDYIKDRDILNLLWQYMSRSSERGGLFWDYRRGISRGCPLSSFIGAFFLKELDDRMERLGLLYVRFMDDILVAPPSTAAIEESGEGRQ